MSNKTKFLLIETKEKTKDRFKRYCKRQGVSLKLGLNTLMETCVRRNFPIKTRMKMKKKQRRGVVYNNE